MKSKEITVAKTTEMKDGDTKKIEIDEKEILISRIDGKFYAVGGSCPHYGASLADGVLCGDQVYCPWHHASFNAKTGELENPPSRDSLPQFELKIEDENVILIVPEKIEKSRVPDMANKDSHADDRTFVVLGGGAAGNMAVQTLREDGFQGRIVMATKENRLPYDRPNLSKPYMRGEAEADWLPLRSKDFYEQYEIEVLLNHHVTGVDRSGKTISFENGDTLKFDKLLLATGGVPRKLDVPGADLKNIFTLRSWDDADDIISAAEKAKSVAVIGASFIGTEVAFSLSKRNLPVTVIAPENVVFEPVLGEKIGTMFQNLHKKNGVEFNLGSKIDKFIGNGQVQSVALQNNKHIDADLVIIGIGVKPATDFLSEFDLQSDGSLLVDEYFCVDEDVYAAGDIATFMDFRTDEKIRVEHWRVAEQQGRHAAHNMAGNQVKYKSIPFFWTSQVDLHFRYVGYAEKWDEIIFDGDPDSQQFLAFYVKDDKVHAAAGVGRDREMDAIEDLMFREKMPAVDDLRQKGMDFLSLAK